MAVEHNPADPAARLRRFEEALRKAGVKLTHQRLEIVREIARCDDHPDAQSIYERVRKRVPTISLDTVYRTLWMLTDLGLLTTLGAPQDRLRFDTNLAPHHHFICNRCGRTEDFFSDEFNTLSIPRAVRALGKVEQTHVELRGVCKECSKS